MKKNIVMVLAALFLTVAGNAQEKMKLLFKDGNVVTYNADDIKSFYFETESGAQAANCEIAFLDELALTTEFAVECKYGSDTEYIMVRAYSEKAGLDNYGDEVLADDVANYGVRIDPSTTVITAYSMPEGSNITLVLIAFNSEGKHGPVYRHRLTTHVEADEPMAKVTECKYNDDEFIYTIEIDDSKVLSYYLFEDFVDNITIGNTAAFGMLWRKAIAADPDKGEYVYGKTFTKARTNGETMLEIATWAVDFDDQFAGAIFHDIYYIDNASRKAKGTQGQGIKIEAYNKDELTKMIKSVNYKVVRR